MRAPFQAIEETNTARKMLSSGSTKGMVDVHLKKEGLSKHLRSEVIASAANSVNRRAKIQSAVIAIGGVVLSCTGGYLYYLCMTQGFGSVKLSIALFMVGLLISIFGLYGAFQNKV